MDILRICYLLFTHLFALFTTREAIQDKTTTTMPLTKKPARHCTDKEIKEQEAEKRGQFRVGRCPDTLIVINLATDRFIIYFTFVFSFVVMEAAQRWHAVAY